MAKKRTNKGGESVAGYFRQVFQEQPNLLHETSNQKLLDRWLADHPDQPEVPKSVKANLANLKSVLRSQQRKQVANRAEEARPKGQRTGTGRRSRSPPPRRRAPVCTGSSCKRRRERRARSASVAC